MEASITNGSVDHRSSGETPDDSCSITIGGSEADMSAFAQEFLTARMQMLQMKEGQPVVMTERQTAVTYTFRDREISPYFSRSKATPTENRLREIAQNIKKQATGKEAGSQTKVVAAKNSGASNYW